MTNDKTKDDIALRRRMVQALAEILADKYDCTIKVKFRNEGSDDGDDNNESPVVSDHRTLCGTDI